MGKVLLVLLASMVASVWCRSYWNFSVVKEYSRNFPCGEPQRRAFSISDFTNASGIFPKPFVVVHRCEHSGCCTSTKHTCSPVDPDNVTLSVLYYAPGHDGKVEIKQLNVTVEDHRKCKCVKTNSIRKQFF